MTTAEILGKRIRAIRVERGFEVVRLAAKLGRTTGWLYKLEVGRAGRDGGAGVSVDELARIATLLGVDVMDLFCDPSDNIRHKLVDNARHARAEALEEVNAFLEWRCAQGAAEAKRAAR